MDYFTIFLIVSVVSFGSRCAVVIASFDVVGYGAVGDGKTDDSSAFLKAWRAVCGATEDPTMIIPAVKTFLLNPVKFQGPCKAPSVHVQVLGNITAPNNAAAWTGFDKCCWISFSDINQLVIDGSGQIDGRGSVWWNQSCSGNDCQRPKALHFNACNGFRLSGLNHVNSPGGHIAISSCNGATVSKIHITAPGDSPNTDGIDISNSTNVQVIDSNIGTGDDCIAINAGCSFINITHITCGPGHGISVGSLGVNGAQDTVEEVHVQHCDLQGTQNGVRIKTWQGGSGYARKISFEEITLTAVQNPIIIDQFYCNGAHSCPNKTSAVAVSDVKYSGVRGTSAVEAAITLNCSQSVGCTNIIMEQINITSSVAGSVTRAYCNNAHGRSRHATPAVTCLSP